MKDGVSFSEVIAIIDRVDKEGRPFPFDISFRTIQRNSKTGGKLITYKGVKKYVPRKFQKSKASQVKDVQELPGIKRNPNHFENRTRNLELQNGEIKKVKIRHIISLNGKIMHY